MDLPSPQAKLDPAHSRLVALVFVSAGLLGLLPTIQQFSSYWVQNGKHGHEELGVILTNGQQVNLIPAGWAAGDLAQALAQYVSTAGTTFPAP